MFYEEETVRSDFNQAMIQGEMVENIQFSHESHGEKFYSTIVAVKRLSGTFDYLPILFSEKLYFNMIEIGTRIKVSGNVRTHLDTHLKVYIFCNTLEETDDMEDINIIYIVGTICKSTYRETPLQKRICDLIVAVNRKFGKADYLPCIVWGRSAIWSSNLPIGTRITLDGRFQSRPYTKYYEGEYFNKVAYEISVGGITLGE